MKTKLTLILAVMLLVSILMSACELPTLKASDMDLNPPAGNPKDAAANHHTPPTDAEMLTAEQSRALILSHLNLTENAITVKEFKLDDGKYELEFILGDMEYDVNMDARTGKVLTVETEPADRRPQATEPVVPPQPTVPPQDDVITLEQAKEIIFAKLGITENQLTRKEFKLDDGKYEIDFYIGTTEYDCEVSLTGQILEIEKNDVSVIPPVDAPQTGAITLEQAKEIIFTKLGITAAQVARLEAELDDGKYEIEFHIGNLEYDCEVSLTGQILKLEKEIDD